MRERLKEEFNGDCLQKRIFGELSNPSNADSPLEKGRRVNVPAGFCGRKKNSDEAFDRIMGSAFGAIFQSTLKHSWRLVVPWAQR